MHFLCDDEGGLCCLGVLADIQGQLSASGDKRNCPDTDEWRRYVQIDSHHYSCTLLGANAPRGLDIDKQGRLAEINDNSNSFAPVIAKIKELFIDGATS